MPGPASCALSVVVPTRNEAANIDLLVRRASRSLRCIEGGWELIFVDDSDDDTPEVIARHARLAEGRVRLLHRERGARSGGLGGAVQAGFALAQGRVLAVMDADLQHPPEVLPRLVAPVLAGRADLAAGTRYGGTGSTDGLAGPWRRAVSAGCRWLTRRALPASRALQDPLSGLFAIRRSVVEGVELRPDGYKILLEVAARGHWRTAVNVSYEFGPRYAGDSKAGLREGMVFFRLLARLVRARRRAAAEGRAAVTDHGLVTLSVAPEPIEVPRAV
jgi:glycosyltransferase involved in cell wall biosynthesis